MSLRHIDHLDIKINGCGIPGTATKTLQQAFRHRTKTDGIRY